MQLNTMKERKAYWYLMMELRSPQEIENALMSLQVNDSKVLQRYYFLKKNFKEIAIELNMSIGMIRNYHNRGIFQLAKYFGDT